MPGLMSMKASVCVGLRWMSLMRSAALRCGLETISAIRPCWFGAVSFDDAADVLVLAVLAQALSASIAEMSSAGSAMDGFLFTAARRTKIFIIGTLSIEVVSEYVSDRSRAWQRIKAAIIAPSDR